MKKVLIVSLSIIFVMLCTAFLLPSIKKVNSLPEDMIVTYSDIHEANESDEFSPLINLSLPKNLDVSTTDELTDTTLNIKLFNLFTIKKVNVRLLNDTDVYVGGETVGFNLFSEGVICVGSNPIQTSEGAKEPIITSGIQDVYPLPAAGVLNIRPNGPCYNTTVDLELVEQTIKQFIK